MSKISLKKNFVMNTLYTMSTFLFSLITFPYISRVLGPDGNGRVTFATSFISYFTLVAQLGIPTYGIRVCAEARDDRVALTRVTHELLMINLIMTALSYAALFVALFTVPRLMEDRALFLIISSTLFLSAVGMEWLYRGLEQYTYITVRSLIFKAIALVATFLLVRAESDYMIYGAISIFATSASNICNFIYARKYVVFHPVGGYDLKRHWKPVMVFFAMACATTLYTYLDVVMLGFMTTDTDVGYYNAAVKIKRILVTLITSLGTVLLPRASYYIGKGLMNEFRRVISRSLNFVFLLSVPLALYFAYFAPQTILLLSGGAYAPSVEPMRWIIPTLPLIGITNVLGIQILVPTGREKTVLWSELAGAGTDLVLNALLIPSLRSTGAAIGTLAAEAVVLAVQYAALRKEAGPLFARVSYGKLILAAAAGSALCFWVPLAGWGNFPTLAAGAVLFFGGYGTTLLLTREPLTRELTGQVLGRLGHGRK